MSELGEFVQKCLKTMTLKEVIDGYAEIGEITSGDDHDKWRRMANAIFENDISFNQLMTCLFEDHGFDLEGIALTILDLEQEVVGHKTFWDEARNHWEAADVIEAMTSFYGEKKEDVATDMINKVFALPPTEA